MKWYQAKRLCCVQASSGGLASSRPTLSRRLPLPQEQHTVVIRAHAIADRTTHSGAARMPGKISSHSSWHASRDACARLSCYMRCAGSSTSSTSCATETLHTTAGMLLACRTPATGTGFVQKPPLGHLTCCADPSFALTCRSRVASVNHMPHLCRGRADEPERKQQGQRRG